MPASRPKAYGSFRRAPATRQTEHVPHRLGDEIACHRKSNLIGACCEPTTMKRRGEACRECSMR